MNNKIKIVYPVTSLEIGGVSSVILNNIKYLNKAKFEPSLLILKYIEPELQNELEKLNIKYLCFNYKNIINIFKLLKIIIFLKKEKIQIVHGNPGTIFRFLAILANIPVIISTYHGTQYFKSKSQIIIDRILNRYTNRIIAISNAVKNHIKEIYKCNENKLVVIYNGIDVENIFNAEIYKNIPNDIAKYGSYIVTTISNLSNEKGLDCLVKAAYLVKKKFNNVKFIIIGDGDYKNEVINMIKKQNMEDTVCLLGKRRDIPEILSVTTISVLPSCIREGLGLALIEAMAMKIPVIGTLIEGIIEVITDGKDGYLVPVGSHQAIADRIIELLGNENLRKKMGEEGRKKAIEKFNIKKTIKELENLYIDSLKDFIV